MGPPRLLFSRSRPRRLAKDVNSKTSANVNRVLVAAVLLVAPFEGGDAYAQSTQEHVHHMAHEVMPFDISRTTHIFRMTESGGVQRVVAKDPGDAQQIALIQQHLQHEASRFQRGDYADPETLHGADMPGLQELRRSAPKIRVTYSPRPDGAQIVFETGDLPTLTAIHRWFGAQLSEHGADAKAE